MLQARHKYLLNLTLHPKAGDFRTRSAALVMGVGSALCCQEPLAPRAGAQALPLLSSSSSCSLLTFLCVSLCPSLSVSPCLCLSLSQRCFSFSVPPAEGGGGTGGSECSDPGMPFALGCSCTPAFLALPWAGKGLTPPKPWSGGAPAPHLQRRPQSLRTPPVLGAGRIPLPSLRAVTSTSSRSPSMLLPTFFSLRWQPAGGPWAQGLCVPTRVSAVPPQPPSPAHHSPLGTRGAGRLSAARQSHAGLR